jgi:uncharacterized CHY-type Zn-finger protein
MFHVLIAIADVERRQWFDQCFRCHQEFSPVTYEVSFPVPFPIQPVLPPVDIILVDLKETHALTAEFWSALHFSHPGARLMALCEPPVSPLALKAALHAGAFYLSDWPTTTTSLYTVARRQVGVNGYSPPGRLGKQSCPFCIMRFNPIEFCELVV